MAAGQVVKEWSRAGFQRTLDGVGGVATAAVVQPAEGSAGAGRLSSLPGEASLFPAMACRTPVAMLRPAWKAAGEGAGPVVVVVVEAIVAGRLGR